MSPEETQVWWRGRCLNNWVVHLKVVNGYVTRCFSICMKKLVFNYGVLVNRDFEENTSRFRRKVVLKVIFFYCNTFISFFFLLRSKCSGTDVNRFSVQKQAAEVFLEISQTSQENTCARASFLIKLLAWGLQLY